MSKARQTVEATGIRRIATAWVGFILLAAVGLLGPATAAATPVAPSGRIPTVLITTGRNYPDALSASILSYAYEAPILLTEPAALPASVTASIVELKPTRAFVLGNAPAVDPHVDAQLKQLGVANVIRIGGANRFATSAAIASQAIDGLREARDARLKEVQDAVTAAVTGIQTQIEALATRVGAVETKTSALETETISARGRLTAIETSVAADDDFWPKGALSTEVTSVVSIGTAKITVYPQWTYTPTGGAKTSIPADAPGLVMRINLGGQDYWHVGTGSWEKSCDSNQVPSGSPIVLEYWAEYCGQRVHRTVTMTDWAW